METVRAPGGADPPWELPAPGTQVGPYIVKGTLGGGGMGDVLLGWDPALQWNVALKFLRSDLAGDADAVRRFSREGRTLAAISNAHVVRVHYVGSWRSRPFIAMEHLEGTDLSARLRAGPLPIDEALPIAEEMAAALAAIHAAGVTHRDIKPANVFLRAVDGSVCLIDFGLARVLARSTDTGGLLRGTPWYMAPEVIARRPSDRRADVYSFGVTLFEMLTGRVPHQDVDGAAFYRAALEEDAPLLRTLLPSAPRPLEVLVARALARSPEFRHADGAALLRAVREARRALSGGPAGPTTVLPATEGGSPHPGPADPSESLPLLGRNAAYGAALRVLDDVAGWGGRLLLVEGEPGAGKSRFLREVVRAARMRALGIMRCDGGEFAGSPFRAVRAAVSGYAASLGMAAPAEVVGRVLAASPANAPLAPALRWFLGRGEEEGRLPPGRTELVQALLALLRTLVLERPVLLVVEDAHELDAGSLDFLLAAAEDGGSWPLGIVMTFRPSGAVTADSPLGAVLPRLRAVPRAEFLVLGPLDETTVIAMVSQTLHLDDEQSRRVAGVILRRSSGNPLYLVEMLRLLQQEKWVGMEGGRYQVRERITELAVPPRMLELAARRVKGLSEWERKVLSVVCVDPTGVSSQLVARCTGLPKIQALQVLHELVRTRELLRHDGDLYRVAHEVVREEVWGKLIPELRAACHAEAAADLAAAGMAEEDPGRLGHHLRHSGRRADAAPLLLEAGRRLLLFHAPAEALDRFRQAEECTAPDRFPEAAVGRAQALEQLGEIAAARRILEECLEAGGASAAAAHLPMAEFLRNRGRHGEALEFLSRASELPLAHDDRVRLLVLEAQELSQRGRFEEALAVLARAEGMAATASPVRLLELLSTRGTVNWRMGRLAEARTALESTAALAESIGSQGRLPLVLYNLGLVASDQRGRTAEALELLDRAVELARLVGDGRVLIRARITRAEILLGDLRLEETAAALDEIEAGLDRLDSADDSFLHATCRAELALLAGDAEEGMRMADRCAALVGAHPRRLRDAGALRARALLEAKRISEALEQARSALALPGPGAADRQSQELVALAARALREEGREGPEREALRATAEFLFAEAAAERVLEETDPAARTRFAAEARRLARDPRERFYVDRRLGAS